MKSKSLLFLFLLFLCQPVFALVGSIDKREYVDWDNWPHIVFFDGGCTAQYIAQDIILTAAHCLDYLPDNSYKEYYDIQLHDGRKTTVKLEAVGPYFVSDGRYIFNQTEGDYALLRVQDPEFYVKKFFNLAASAKNINVETFGFGMMRILTDEELLEMNKLWNEVATEHKAKVRHGTDYNVLYELFSEKLKSKNIPSLKEKGPRLKKSQCDLFYFDKRKTYVPMGYSTTDSGAALIFSNCDVVNGDSGGAILDSDNLLAILSIGNPTLQERMVYNVNVPVENIYQDFMGMKKNFDYRGNMKVLEIDDIQGKAETTDTGLAVRPVEDTLVLSETALSGKENTDVQMLQQQLDDKSVMLGEAVENLNQMDEKQFFRFLDANVEYEILREKYEAAKQREQSLSNRTLGAVAMGAGGIGGMMLASGLAEQSAEQKAEMDMAAYLATFKCDYGSGMNVNGGAKNVQIPGSVELMPMYAEYVTLANDLKLRKEQLGLKPGIESEALLDSATTGLYDDVSNGLTRGVYASLSRALKNPEGADAKKWAEQVESAKQKTKTGSVIGGAGVVGGAIGDLIINRDAN